MTALLHTRAPLMALISSSNLRRHLLKWTSPLSCWTRLSEDARLVRVLGRREIRGSFDSALGAALVDRSCCLGAIPGIFQKSLYELIAVPHALALRQAHRGQVHR